MDSRSPYQLDVASDQRYPDPRAHTSAAGPFYNHTNNRISEDVEGAADLAQQLAGAAASPGNNEQRGIASQSQNNEFQQELTLHRASTSGPSIAQSPIAPQPGDAGDASNGQKKARTKVSRACDECRRKKIRCDAIDIDEGKPCSSCERTGIRCQFSRQPMKRGPSKGYIKELADRLNSLENQLQPQQPQPQVLQSQSQQPQRLAGHDFAESGTGYYESGQQARDAPPSTRKRTHSVSEGANHVSEHRHSPYVRVLPAGQWSPPRAHQAAVLGQSRSVQPVLQHRPATAETSMPRPAQGSHAGSGWSYGTVQEGRARELPQSLPTQPQREPETSVSFEWDESVIDEYVVHADRCLLANIDTATID